MRVGQCDGKFVEKRTMIKENISAMSDEHTSWLSALGFYKQELDVVKKRLTEVAGKNSSKEVGAEIEHFENQLAIQKENIDKLIHNINENLAKSAEQAMANSAGYVDAELLKENTRQKESFMTEEKIVNELRQDLNRFLSKWM